MSWKRYQRSNSQRRWTSTRCSNRLYSLASGYLTACHESHGPFIDHKNADLPIKLAMLNYQRVFCDHDKTNVALPFHAKDQYQKDGVLTHIHLALSRAQKVRCVTRSHGWVKMWFLWIRWRKATGCQEKIYVTHRLQQNKKYLGWNLEVLGENSVLKSRVEVVPWLKLWWLSSSKAAILRWIPQLQRGCNAACHDGPFTIRCCTQKSRFRLAKNVQKIDESNESIPQVICICHRLSGYLWWLRPFKNIPRLVKSTWLGAVYIFQACLRPDPREGERDWQKMVVLQLDR